MLCQKRLKQFVMRPQNDERTNPRIAFYAYLSWNDVKGDQEERERTIISY